MTNETKAAFQSGVEDRIAGSSINPYSPSATESYYWVKGYLGMQYKNQAESELRRQLTEVHGKLDRIKAKNAMPADEFNTARMNKAINELAASRLETENAQAENERLKKTIDKLALQISREKKQINNEKNQRKNTG